MSNTQPPITLRRAWVDYKTHRKLKPSTAKSYEAKLIRCFEKWLDKELSEITKDMIQDRHRELSLDGEALANLGMRILKAVFNYACARFGITTLENPVKRLSEVRAWNKIRKRRTMIVPSDMPAWWHAVVNQRSTTLRDYLLVLILTGLRRTEAATMRWEDIDFREATLTVRNTKNGHDHTLPLPPYLFQLLRRRREVVSGEYVFPGRDRGTHLSIYSKDPVRVVRDSGVTFMLHDLRRTFGTTARRLKIDPFAIKALLNHHISDVTAGYIVIDVEDLREPMALIEAELLRQASEAPKFGTDSL